MTAFDVTVPVAAPAEQVWAALVDWPSHGRWMPLTTVRVTSADPDGVGATFVARTGVGRLAVDDPMVVTEWLPPVAGRPGRCILRKTGQVVLGSAALAVEPVGPRRARVRWHEEVDIAPVALTRRLAPVVRVAGRSAFGLALCRFARRVEAGAGRPR